MTKKRTIVTGTKYGHLTVIKEGEKKYLPSGQTNRTILCKCDCGIVKTIRISHLISGKTISCGCGNGINSIYKTERLYKKWLSMNYRCHVIKTENYCTRKNIKVCDEWKTDYLSFKKWCLNNGYKEELAIDRKDNDKGYGPDNCRFVTNIVNVNNRSNTFKVWYNGEEVAFMQLIHEKKLWLHATAIRNRIKRGWSANYAFDKPIKKGRYYRVIKTNKEALKKMQIKDSIL